MAKQSLANEDENRDREENNADRPLIDNVNQTVKNLIKKGKERGYLTYDEVNAALPQEEMSSEQIEDVMSALSEMGVNVVENEEQDDSAPEAKAEDEKTATGTVADDDVGRTDDPVRMYLREMGSVELLSREGEIAIAKRIEAGREMMIAGICESPLTIKALIQWRNALKEEKSSYAMSLILMRLMGQPRKGLQMPLQIQIPTQTTTAPKKTMAVSGWKRARPSLMMQHLKRQKQKTTKTKTAWSSRMRNALPAIRPTTMTTRMVKRKTCRSPPWKRSDAPGSRNLR